MLNADLRVPPSQGRLRGALYNLNSISSEDFDEQGNWLLSVNVPMSEWNKLKKEIGEQIDGYLT